MQANACKCTQMVQLKNMLKAGTYAWMVAKKNQAGKLVRSKSWTMEKEAVSQIGCVRMHSYRAKAIGLLSGLMFLQHVEWKGHVEWHTDSQSVIDTWKRLHCKHEPNWLKQKERDICITLWTPKAHWKGRLKIYRVKAHADTLKMKSTEDEKSNQTVDKLAEDAYNKLEHTPVGENGVINQNSFTTVGTEMYIQGVYAWMVMWDSK